MKTASWGKSVLALTAVALFLTSQPAIAAPQDIVVSLSPTPKFKSMDGKTRAEIIGFIQAEAVFNREDDGKSELVDGSSVRRARLGISGTFGDGWGYKYLHDFGNDSPAIQDAFLTYDSANKLQFKVGHFKEILGLEYQGAVTNWQFMELPLTDALTPRRAVGAGVLYNNYEIAGHALRINLAGFGGTASEDQDTDKTASESVSIDLNVAIQLVKENMKQTHLGFMVSHRMPRADTLSLNVNANTSTGQAMLDTGNLTAVNDSLLYGLQGLSVMGPLSVQAEYVVHDINGTAAAGSDVSLSAFYIHASYFLTGESRGYNFKKYGRNGLKPSDPFSNKGGRGAFEVAARYEVLDFNDGTFKKGQMKKATLGFNWYPNSKVRFQANYSLVNTDEYAVVANDDPQILMLRAQVGF